MSKRCESNKVSNATDRSIASAASLLEIAERTIVTLTSVPVWCSYIQCAGKNRWSEAEHYLLKGYKNYDFDIEEVCDYACHGIQGRWAEVEALLLSDALTVTDTGYDLYDSVIYAMRVIKGRWPALEERLAADDGEGMTANIFLYAQHCVKGRLPEDLHNRMLAESLKNQDDPWLKKYFGAKKYQKVRKPR